MKKHLLLTGLLAVLTFNSAHAQEYYYEDDGYYYEIPRYEQQKVVYQEPKYERVEIVDYQPTHPIVKIQPRYEQRTYPTKREQPRYRRITNAEAKQYEDKRIIRTEEIISDVFRPYVGFDVSSSDIKFKQKILKELMEDSYKSGSIIIGAKLNNRFGFEGFYQQSMEETKNIDSSYKVKSDYSAIGLDFIAYTPISQEVEILVALGMAQYNFHETEKEDTPLYSAWEKDTFDTTGYRLGLGMQFNLSEYVAVRGMVRYITFYDTDIIKNMVELSLGMRYMF